LYLISKHLIPLNNYLTWERKILILSCSMLTRATFDSRVAGSPALI